MGIKFRLTLLNFLQFFVWGAWLISFGSYMGGILHFDGTQIGAVYATMGIASLFMPGLLGIIADRFINAERLYGICHLLGAATLILVAQFHDFWPVYWLMLFNSLVYMPTLSLDNSVCYSILEQNKKDVVKDFPPIRVWGTIGFIVAMWVVDLMGLNKTNAQLYVGAIAAIVLGIYAFTLPKCPPLGGKEHKSWVSAMGLDAFKLFKRRKMAVFLLFSMLLGAALQITNAFGEPFLHSFADNYKGFFAVEHPSLLLSISQVSETLFILCIPFFLKHFGIKKIMIISMLAWVFRFAFFGLGDPGSGLYLLILSMIVYGMAFDFFNISGSLFIEEEVDNKIRSSAQGLFIIMTNGFGVIIGGYGSGWVVDHFTINGVRDWESIWFVFAGYALLLAIIFPFIFHYKHQKKKTNPMPAH